MALKITITDAGRAALINANKSGTQAISIVSVGVSATAITADKSQTNLPDEIKRITAISGEVTAADAIHLTAKDDGDSIYTVRSFALYLDDGTLFAIYGQSSPILEKSAAAMLLLQLDIRFADIDATQIQFGNLDFVNPAATEKTAGVTRLTELGEAEQSVENIAVSPVELRRYAEKLARQADMIAALATKFDKAGGVINGTTSINDGILQLNKSRSGLWNTLNFATSGAMRWSVVSDDSAETGNNVGSDFHITRILDNGKQIFALNISRATGLVDVPASFQVGGVRPYSPHNDGEGSGLNAEYWRGLAPNYFTPQSSTDALVNSLNAAIDRRIYGDYGIVNGGKRGFAAYNLNGRVAFCSKNADGSDDWVWLPNAIELQQLSDTVSALLAQKFDKAGGVINGTTSINDGILQLNKSRSGLWNTLNFATSGAMRWSVVSDDSAETGNNVGSDFHITRILDNGKQIFALNISRATGLVDVPASFQVGGVRPYSPHNDGEGSGLNAEYWRGLAPDHFVANSQIITYDVPNGHIKKINDTVELHLTLDNIIGTTQLPYNFTRIDSVIPVLNRDTSRAGWCDVEDNNLNTVTISAHMMSHGNLDSINQCSGSISVYGKG
ncbi:MAG: hypothetical protein ABF697_09040 [Zymomonas mobilis]|uniref:hypothetical protein n=1 Tax=Zymomonas mobilis TaxID=542 RepID=UPI0039ECBBDB